MLDHSRIARLAADLEMSMSEVEEMIASEAADLARCERAYGNAAVARTYDEIATAQWLEAATARTRSAVMALT